MSADEDPVDDQTFIGILIESDMSGDPYDFGLRYPNDNVPFTDAQSLLDYIKQDSQGSKSTFISDWCLMDDPRIVISVRRPDESGTMQHSVVEW